MEFKKLTFQSKVFTIGVVSLVLTTLVYVLCSSTIFNHVMRFWVYNEEIFQLMAYITLLMLTLNIVLLIQPVNNFTELFKLFKVHSFLHSILFLNAINLLFIIAFYLDLSYKLKAFDRHLDEMSIVFIINMLLSNLLAIFCFPFLEEEVEDYITIKFKGEIGVILTSLWFLLICLIIAFFVIIAFALEFVLSTYFISLYIFLIVAILRPSVKYV